MPTVGRRKLKPNLDDYDGAGVTFGEVFCPYCDGDGFIFQPRKDDCNGDICSRCNGKGRVVEAHLLDEVDI